MKLRYLEWWEVKEARVQELSTCSVCFFLCLFCVFCFVVWFLFCFSRFWLVPLFLWVIVCFRSLLLHKVTLCSPNIGIVGIIKEVDYGTVPPFRQSVHFCARVGKKTRKKKEIDVRVPDRTLGTRHLPPRVASGALTTSSSFSADHFLTRATDFSE